MAPRILIFSMAMGVDYSIELIFIGTYAPQFIWYNIFFLGRMAESVKDFYNNIVNWVNHMVDWFDWSNDMVTSFMGIVYR